MDLFAYGTLMEEAVFRRVAGSALSGVPAVAPGWIRRRVRGQVYPGIIPQAGGIVNGIVYAELTPVAWKRLDAFEGEMYERSTLVVRTEDGCDRNAFAYVVKSAFRSLLTADDWSFDDFRSRDLPAYVRNLEVIS